MTLCRRWLLPAMCVLAVLALASCGGKSKLERALESVPENDLAIMVLPQGELGEEFSDLEIRDDSGFVDNEASAEDSLDPADTADDHEQAGRIIGYNLGYWEPTLSPVAAGEGAIVVFTQVELFRDAGAASDFLAQEVAGYETFEGERVQVGFILEEVERFAVDGLADEAIGLRARGSLGRAEVYGTGVAFRLDRLLGWAVQWRADDADVNSQVEEIARALEQRIEGVLLGEITD